ncbi:hypothetical protein KO481_16435 [Nocardia sp. NEAU-G5]|uniref:Uncharacterized protein n=1 Tax=Nocardia albiluteola TaxID=2842303 RepID=A0ABS6AYI6_9NOCA|nr:hypothetical protein [Nocardia albiluteola]MBU3063109.1 hypothetical protein [Nocardia albiluteola]
MPSEKSPTSTTTGSEVLAVVLGAMLLVVIAPGAVIIGLAWLAGLRGYAAAKHRRWWMFLTPERWWMVAGAATGVAVVLGSLAWAIALMRAGRFETLVAPAVVSLAAGALAAPGTFVLARRHLRLRVLEGRTDDVLATAQIAEAVRRADDELTARSVGVSLDEHTVDLRVIDPERRMTAPVPVEVDTAIRYGIGIVVPEDRLTDVERSSHFTAPGCDLLLAPQVAGQMRALILAGSGTGKTELIAGFHATANRVGMTSVLIDLKAQAYDANRFGEDARRQREYVGSAADVRVVRGGWDFFDCPREQLLERLMFIAPKASSTDFYSQRMRRVLDLVIDGRGTKPLVRSLEELTDRLADPVKVLGRRLAGPIVEEDRFGQTDAGMVAADVDAMFAPLRKYLPKTGEGWSFSRLAPGSATIVSLNPVLAPELLLANLILRDLRDFLASRAESPIDPARQQPVAVIVDEFPQMVEREVDAAEEAAKVLETARAANVGLILAGQSIEGYSRDPQMQRRLLGAGVAIFLGRSALPDTVTEAAGTRWQLEVGGDPWGFSINTAHAKWVFQVLPQYVRRMHVGMFWVIHEGAAMRFLTFQTA